MAGGIGMGDTNAIIENCYFTNNSSSMDSAALYAAYCTGIIRNNEISENQNNSLSVVHLMNYILSNFTGNSIVRNTCLSTNQPALFLSSCTGTLSRQIIANNDGTGILVEGSNGFGCPIQNCLIVNKLGWGVRNIGRVTFNSCIIWGNGQGSLTNTTYTITIKYSDIQGGQYGINGTFIGGSDYLNNISGNPLFVSPTATNNSSSNPLVVNWTLQLASPCIVTGDPALPKDADASIVDMGMYSRWLKPLLTRAADVSPDQGHQLDLQWDRGELDTSFQQGAFYSVWRQEVTRANTQWLESPLSLASAMQNAQTAIAWRDGDRVWDYLAQVPAVNFSSYGLIVPTLQDSSATGIHSADYMVMYQNSQGWWPSIVKNGYSVDNIPPAQSQNLVLQPVSTNSYLLGWEEVSEGYWEGNSYPELNQITYKVYCGNTPEFVVSPASFIGLTTDPQMIINTAASQRFFRIIVSDSE